MRGKWLRVVGAVAALGLSCSAREVRPAPPVAGRCALEGKPELIARDDVAVHELWELPDSEVLWSDAMPDSEALRHYLEVSRARADVDPMALLRRQHDVHAAPGRSEGMRRDAANMRRVLEGKVGRMARANCLERLLFALQAERYPMIEHPTEFGAFVLRKGEGGPDARVQVYFSSMNRVGGRLSREVMARVEADAKQGWVVLAHLHNHSLLFDRKVGDRMWTTEETKDDIGGGISPSLNDVQFYQNAREDLRLRGAWVTNGFDTLHLTAAEIGSLEAAR